MCILRNKIAMGFAAKEILTSGLGLHRTYCLAVKNSTSNPLSPTVKLQYLISLR